MTAFQHIRWRCCHYLWSRHQRWNNGDPPIWRSDRRRGVPEAQCSSQVFQLSVFSADFVWCVCVFQEFIQSNSRPWSHRWALIGFCWRAVNWQETSLIWGADSEWWTVNWQGSSLTYGGGTGCCRQRWSVPSAGGGTTGPGETRRCFPPGSFPCFSQSVHRLQISDEINNDII